MKKLILLLLCLGFMFSFVSCDDSSSSSDVPTDNPTEEPTEPTNPITDDEDEDEPTEPVVDDDDEEEPEVDDTITDTRISFTYDSINKCFTRKINGYNFVTNSYNSKEFFVNINDDLSNFLLYNCNVTLPTCYKKEISFTSSEGKQMFSSTGWVVSDDYGFVSKVYISENEIKVYFNNINENDIDNFDVYILRKKNIVGGWLYINANVEYDVYDEEKWFEFPRVSLTDTTNIYEIEASNIYFSVYDNKPNGISFDMNDTRFIISRVNSHPTLLDSSYNESYLDWHYLSDFSKGNYDDNNNPTTFYMQSFKCYDFEGNVTTTKVEFIKNNNKLRIILSDKYENDVTSRYRLFYNKTKDSNQLFIVSSKK